MIAAARKQFLWELQPGFAMCNFFLQPINLKIYIIKVACIKLSCWSFLQKYCHELPQISFLLDSNQPSQWLTFFNPFKLNWMIEVACIKFSCISLFKKRNNWYTAPIYAFLWWAKNACHANSNFFFSNKKSYVNWNYFKKENYQNIFLFKVNEKWETQKIAF